MPSFTLEKVLIPLSVLRKGKDTFSSEIPYETIELDSGRICIELLRINVKFSMIGEDILMDMSLWIEGEFRCDRCAETFSHCIEGKLTTLFTPDPLKIREADGGEIRLFNIHANELDITQEIMDGVFLTIPEKVLCKETCQGLCSLCGKNLNEGCCSCLRKIKDTRWDALKNIKFEDK